MKIKDKWNRNKNFNKKKLVFLQLNINMPHISKRAYLKASATLEASLVIPIFIYAVMTISYLIYALGVKVHISQALYNETRQLSRFVYMMKNNNSVPINTLVYATAQSQFINELGVSYASTHNIAGGNAGLLISSKDIINDNNEIKLSVSYAIRNPFNIFGTGLLRYEQSYVSKAWLGENGSTDNYADSDNATFVYITMQGEVYHRNSECTYLKPVISEVSTNSIGDYRNSSGAIYYQCERCAGSLNSEKLYITEYGTRFHTTPNCSEIKRNVIRVKLSTVSDRRACAKCG